MSKASSKHIRSKNSILASCPARYRRQYSKSRMEMSKRGEVSEASRKDDTRLGSRNKLLQPGPGTDLIGGVKGRRERLVVYAPWRIEKRKNWKPHKKKIRGRVKGTNVAGKGGANDLKRTVVRGGLRGQTHGISCGKSEGVEHRERDWVGTRLE